jgi:fatty-acyl-CoA synthase
VIAGEQVRRALRSAGDRPVVHVGGQSWTGSALDQRTDALAGILQRRVRPGGQVGLWYWNSAHALVAHLATERAGLTRVPVDPGAATPEARAIWDAAGVDLVVCDGAHAASVPAATVFDRGDEPPAGPGPGPAEVGEDVTHLLFPRSVASGGLLAIPISYGGWMAHMRVNAALFRDGTYGPPVSAADTLVTVQQIMHGTGLVATFPFLMMGLPQVVLERFDAPDVLEAVERYGATTSFMVPGMVTRLAGQMAGRARRTGLTRIVYGGAPVSAGELRHSLDRLGPVLTQIYGRLEGGWPLTVLDRADHARISAGDDTLLDSCGRAIPGIELDIRPDGTAEGRGELRVRGDMVSPAFRDPDGWCSLGDLASVDAAGYYRLHGRLDGMINTGAYHVCPAEVAEAIREMLAVTEVTVAAEADPKWGEAVTATLTWPAEASVPDDAAIRRTLRERLAPYKVPTHFHHRRIGSGQPASG